MTRFEDDCAFGTFRCAIAAGCAIEWVFECISVERFECVVACEAGCPLPAIRVETAGPDVADERVVRAIREPRAALNRVGRRFARVRLVGRIARCVIRSIRFGSGPLVRTTPFAKEKRVVFVPLRSSVAFCVGDTRTVEALTPTKLRVGTKT
jgi:hypothetical protein